MTVRAPTYAGLFLLTMATLMHEILLTRIFSVTLWYHFAFVAISVAMFGMTVGAVWVYLNPDRYPVERAPRQLATHALGQVAGQVVIVARHVPDDAHAASDPHALATVEAGVEVVSFYIEQHAESGPHGRTLAGGAAAVDVIAGQVQQQGGAARGSAVKSREAALRKAESLRFRDAADVEVIARVLYQAPQARGPGKALAHARALVPVVAPAVHEDADAEGAGAQAEVVG